MIWMLSRCSPSPRDALAAFADDIAMFLMMFLSGRGWLIEVMVLVLAATGLQVSIDRAVVILMWTTEIEQARGEFAQRVPAAERVSVVQAFRHLGVVGPEAEATR